jgi:hypothetical protein
VGVGIDFAGLWNGTEAYTGETNRGFGFSPPRPQSNLRALAPAFVPRDAVAKGTCGGQAGTAAGPPPIQPLIEPASQQASTQAAAAEICAEEEREERKDRAERGESEELEERELQEEEQSQADSFESMSWAGSSVYDDSTTAGGSVSDTTAGASRSESTITGDSVVSALVRDPSAPMEESDPPIVDPRVPPSDPENLRRRQQQQLEAAEREHNLRATLIRESHDANWGEWNAGRWSNRLKDLPLDNHLCHCS